MSEERKLILQMVAEGKVTVEEGEMLLQAVDESERLVLDNQIGDVAVRFTAGAELAMEVRKSVWGADRADAEERAALTTLSVIRRGADLVVEPSHPHISAVGSGRAPDPPPARYPGREGICQFGRDPAGPGG